MGECFFRYQRTRVVPDNGPLNGCVRVRVCMLEVCCIGKWLLFSLETARFSVFILYCFLFVILLFVVPCSRIDHASYFSFFSAQ